MTTQSRRRRATLAVAVGAAVSAVLVGAGGATASADPTGPEPVPGPDVSDPGYDPYLPPLTDIGGPATDVFIEVPAAAAPEPLILPWFIYENVGTGALSLAQQNPGFGWQQFSGPYFSFVEGGADMNAFGVPGWEAF